MFNKFLSMLLLVLIVACSPPPEPTPAEPTFTTENADELSLSFGLYASDDPASLVKQFRPVLRHLENKLSTRLDTDVNITLVLTRTYDLGIQAIVDGKFDFTRTGPASYLEAYALDHGVEILAMESVEGRKVFNGIIAVHKTSPITNISELKGNSFAFGDEGSTIGRWLSQQYLYDNGITANDLSNFEYLGRHDLVGKAVGSGQFVAGALNEKTFNALVDSGVQIRMLARFENVTKPWFVSSTLDSDVAAILKEELLLLTDEYALHQLKVDGFLPGEHLDYKAIEDAISQNHLFFD